MFVLNRLNAKKWFPVHLFIFKCKCNKCSCINHRVHINYVATKLQNTQSDIASSDQPSLIMGTVCLFVHFTFNDYIAYILFTRNRNWCLSGYNSFERSISLHTEKSRQNLIKSTRNQIVFTIFRLIWMQTDVYLVPYQPKNGKYNLISV